MPDAPRVVQPHTHTSHSGRVRVPAAQPRLPHPASAARPGVVQRMKNTNSGKWKLPDFKDYIRSNRRENDEELNEDQLWEKLQRDKGQSNRALFAKAFGRIQNEPFKTVTNVQIVNKPKLWSTAYIYNGRRWTAATRHDRPQRPTKNKHTEQRLYSTMNLPDEPVWIGFVQNEWPCIGCCDFFSTASTYPEIEGVIFSVQDSGGYAFEHGQELGSNGTVYFYNGAMTYTRPPEAPPPP
jgi:hypothetical protein